MPTDRVHRLIGNKPARGFPRWRWPRQHPIAPGRAALHPIRRATPDPLRYTHYGALHPNRRGVMPTDRVHRLIGNKLERRFSPLTLHMPTPHRPRPCSTALGTAAMH